MKDKWTQAHVKRGSGSRHGGEECRNVSVGQDVLLVIQRRGL